MSWGGKDTAGAQQRLIGKEMSGGSGTAGAVARLAGERVGSGLVRS